MDDVERIMKSIYYSFRRGCMALKYIEIDGQATICLTKVHLEMAEWLLNCCISLYML